MEHTGIMSNEMDEPRAYDTERNMPEREKQILCVNTYAWNLETCSSCLSHSKIK